MVESLDMEQQVTEVHKWLKTQPQMPQNIDKIYLKRFVYAMYGDVEAAKRLIELHFKLRNKYDHIFLQRDPMDDRSQKLLEAVDYLQLPGKTKENYKLILYRLNDPDPDKYNFTESIRTFFMMADSRFATDNEDVDGEVPIFDMKGYTLKHVTRTNLRVLRIFMKFTQEAHPVRIKQIHLINVPTFLDKVLSLLKPFIKAELYNLLQFHLPDTETLYEFCPREMLPEEYGGKAGKLSELRSYWLGKLMENREYIMDESKWKMDKSTKSTLIPKFVQSIKQLDID